MYTKELLTDSQYQELKARYDAYHAAREELCKGRNYVTVEEQAILPSSCTSEEISQLEVYEFMKNPPTKYFAYVTIPEHGGYKITTWTGELLGRVTHYGEWVSNMGDRRASIRVKAINGKMYHGTFYKSTGDYCRLTMSK